MISRWRLSSPRCIIIAGPNGSGKTTFAREYLLKDANVVNFINSDLIIGARTMKRTKVKKETKEFSAAVGRALRRAAKVARKTARMYGTPIYIWENGKVVAKKP